MSVKASISSSAKHHLYFDELLADELKYVFLEITNPTEFSITKETLQQREFESLNVQIPTETMDEIAIAWIKKRRLQGALGGPVGNEWGSPDCPWE